ncbi:MAG: ferredoxin [Gammaproteobacteria bacterium SG8_47]|nr:MAG: ferredoxin [Gammaproteobacteria bacterium SG8_47]
MGNPCLSCGACCAHFRVSFYWTEAEPFLGGAVPAHLTVPVSTHRLAMGGTDRTCPRCVALEGELAQEVRCSIYAQRPSPCREFEPSWHSGQPNPRCDQARIALGLEPLEPTPSKPRRVPIAPLRETG